MTERHARQHSERPSTRPSSTVSRRFASEWWDANGKFRTLHLIGPARLTFLRDAMLGHFALAKGEPATAGGTLILDIGCGGGLVCEPLARLGAAVTGIDPAADNIEAARRHAAGQDLDIDYQCTRVEDLVAEGRVVRCGDVPGGGGARAGRRRLSQDLRGAGAAGRA